MLFHLAKVSKTHIFIKLLLLQHSRRGSKNPIQNIFWLQISTTYNQNINVTLSKAKMAETFFLFIDFKKKYLKETWTKFKMFYISCALKSHIFNTLLILCFSRSLVCVYLCFPSIWYWIWVFPQLLQPFFNE